MELDSANQVQVQYTYGDDLISQDRAGSVSYYHYDGLGSTRALSNAAGDVTDTYNYEAFGELLNSTGSTENKYRYAGEQTDSFLGMQYLRARYYDSGIGRFSTMDEWPGIYDEPITLNKYLYGNADPVMNVDPTGRFATLGGFNVGFSVQGVLAASNVVSGAVDVFKLASSPAKMSAGQFGTTVLLRMLPGKSALKLYKMTRKGKKTHGNSKKSNKPQHLYAIVDTTDGSIYKYGISGGKLNKNGTSGRANTQANKLNKAANFKRYRPVVLHSNIANREIALTMEYSYVYGYKQVHGSKPIGNKRP